MTRVVILMLAILVACAGGEHRPARSHYNDGLTALATPDYDAAEKALLAAISDAGVDPEVRFAAAYNLASAYTGHAEQSRTAQPPDLEHALELLGQAAGWLHQALKLRPADADTLANLTLVTGKRSALLDELAKDGKALAARLDALIDAHRTVRDQIKALEEKLTAAVAAGDVAPLQAELTAMADRERILLTDAGVVGDMAADEIDGIGAKADDERTDDEKMRLVQLKNLDVYLQDARARLGEARRKLQDRVADAALDRAEAALEALKRAREQLLDPVATLRGIAADQLAVLQQTAYLSAATGAGGWLAPSTATDLKAPPWLTEASLTIRQGALRDRVDEVQARLQAGLDGAAAHAAAPVPDDPQAAQQQAQQQKTMALVAKAAPSVATATEAMQRAHDALVGSKLPTAQDNQRSALLALALAIEQFAELRQTIDLAVAEQARMVTLLAPPDAKAPPMPPAERAQEVERGMTQNLDRLGRLTSLLVDELQKRQAEAAQAAPAPVAPGAAPDPAAADAQAQAQQALSALFAQAETLRARATIEVTAMQAALAANRAGIKGDDPVAAATVAQATLRELQKLFFSVIEHLQELIRQQGETRDQTVRAQGEDDLGRAPLLPGLVQQQGEHGSMADAIADALASQADQASAAPKGQAQGPSPEDLGKAAEEVRAGRGEMTSASTVLGEAADPAATTSVDIAPGVDAQAKALEHLIAALRLLQPPPSPQDQQQQDQQPQQQDQSKQDQPQQPDPQAKPQDGKPDQREQQDPSGALQRVREAEAQRRKDQQARERAQPAPVDRDW